MLRIASCENGVLIVSECDNAEYKQTEEASDQVSTTRSVGRNLARPFKAGNKGIRYRRSVGIIESSKSQASPGDANNLVDLFRP
jgi:hypothetical protein